MRITGVETVALRYAMPYALGYARGEYDVREALLVKVHTDDGLVGWGESAMWGGPHATTAAVIEREIAPLLIGQDPRRPEYLWEKVYQETYYHGRKGLLLTCLSGVDIALWDILGKCAGQPLWRLLGGFGRPVAAYASAGYYRREYGLDALAADVARARRAGYRGYKMKVGNVPRVVHAGVLDGVPHRVAVEDDFRRIRTAREALGSGADLMCDASTSLDLPTALRYAEELERVEARWFEEPTQPEDVAACAELASRTRIPIAGFETETSKYQFARLMDAGAIRVVQPDVIQVGGLTEARKIAHYAQMRHLDFTAKSYSTVVSWAACLQLLYALPNADHFECDQDPLPWREELTADPLFAMADGLVAPTERPGLGIDILEERLARWRVA